MVEKSEDRPQNRPSEWVDADDMMSKPDLYIEMETDQMDKEYYKAIEAEHVESEKISNFLKAQKQLEEVNFIKSVGHDSRGVINYMIFGQMYPKENTEQFKVAIRDMMEFINSR